MHARLLARAKARGEDFNWILSRYAVERFLYRLSISPTRDRYWLKGALLFELWFATPHRPTRDADFLGFGPDDSETLAAAVREISAVEADDAMVFDPRTIQVEEIREGARYSGLRVKLVGRLGNARCPVQLDVGFGDAVTPGPVEIEFPTLLSDQPAPRLRAYPRATVVAEKLEAIVSLGMTNSRMKDYFDLFALAREGGLGAELLGEAIAATFVRRETPLPTAPPLGLSEEFARDATKQTQWKAFLAKNKLDAATLGDVVTEIRRFVAEPLRIAAERTPS